jgi:tol-pal system protein YbgF
MKKIITTAVALAIVSIVSAPAGAQNREHAQMAADLRMLQENQQQLAVAIAQLADAIKGLNARLDDVTNATRKGFADQKIELDKMAGDVNALRNNSNETFVKVGTLSEELEAIRKSMTSLGPSAVSAAPVDPSLTPTEPAPTTAPPPSTVGLSPTRMYDEAFADYGAGQYTSAINGFDQFIKAFPRSANADKAQFYIGEAQFAQKRFAEAITAYNAVIQNYPTGDQVPSALYKRGLAQSALGQNDAAKGSWELAVQKFPDSDGGRLARQSLERLTPAAKPR